MDAGPRIKGKSIMLCLPHISCSESPNKGNRSDLACKYLPLNLFNCKQYCVQNYTKDVQAAQLPDLFCERRTQVLAEKHSKYC